MAVDESDRAIARSVLALGRDLGLVTVAEGVESREGWDLLTKLGCDLAQGFVVCPPLTASQFGEWLGRRPPDEFAYLDDRYADEIAAYRGRMALGPASSDAGTAGGHATAAGDALPDVESVTSDGDEDPVPSAAPVIADATGDDAAEDGSAGASEPHGNGSAQVPVDDPRGNGSGGAVDEPKGSGAGGTVDEPRGNGAGGTVIEVVERPDAADGEVAVDLADGDAVVDLAGAADGDGAPARDQTSGQG